ncbi:hypothetical protein HPB48_004173 [Haemaphysalis longicornis]|uniref:TIL domain-containing protein n=1 Tax=Haemaphysalis longicornis TaxID=44386 RepID=A0A9J6FSN5_HAELO|nr:hypothetical protein HPB48_004173 [Haemaphysalis longicornis]
MEELLLPPSRHLTSLYCTGWDNWPQECGPGQVFKSCVSSSCGEDRCGDDPVPSRFRACTLDCATGCFCDHGYYRRSSDNKCVRRADC